MSGEMHRKAEAAAPGGEWSRGALPLLAGFLGMIISTGPMFQFSASIFIKPLNDEFGWSRTEISLGTTILYLGISIVAPVVGHCLDRWSMRRVILVGGLASATAYVLLGMMTGSMWQFFAVILLMATIGAGCSTIAFSRVINVYFDKARGTANAIGLSGSGVGSAFSPYLLSVVIQDHGWRSAYFTMGAFILVLMPIIWLLLGANARGPQTKHPAAGLPGVPFAVAVRDSTLWRLWAAVLFMSICVGGVVGHFVPMAVALGMTPLQAAAAAGSIGASMAIGRLASGIVMDHVFAPWVGAATFGIGCLGCLALTYGGVAGAVPGAIAIGLCAGTEMDLLGYLCARYFGMRAFGSIYGLVFTAATLGAAVAAPIYGHVVDVTGDYSFALLGSAVLLAIGAVLMLASPRFPKTLVAAA